LVLFFTNGISLKDWDKAGILSREIALYVELIKYGWDISFITYGNKSEYKYKKQLNGINIYCNKYGLPQKWYETLIFIIHRKVLRKSHLIKTNQMSGADIALKASKKFGKPIINRNGYLPSTGLLNGDKKCLQKFQSQINYEKKIFEASDSIVVTTNKLEKDVCNLGVNIKKIRVIPNYIDTKIFCYINDIKKEFDTVFIGRITKEKNIENLLIAITKTNHSLLIIGEGVEKEPLLKKYKNFSHQMTWVNRIPNNQLPKALNKSKLLILPSHYEGHPKVIIEAMCCGTIVIGTNVRGINNLIRDGETGFLCETDSDSIRNTINKVLNFDESELAIIRENAIEFAINNFAIEKVVKMENDLYKKVIRDYYGIS